MSQYRIPLVWSMYGHIWVEADTEEQAKEIALDSETALPDGEYIDDSIEVDKDADIEIR